MKSCLLILATLITSQSLAQDVLTLPQVVANKDRVGVHLLDQGYSGEFSKRFDEDGRELGPDPKPFEYTHASFPSGKHPNVTADDLPINEIVVGLEEPASTGGFAYRAPTVAVAKIPAFDELKKLKNISDYEKIFGKFRGFTDAWGMNGEWHSSKGWMGFTLLDDGKIRVVSVFLHTENKGDGWKISTRRIREGVFQPTRKPPVLEKAEPRDARESPR
ncbi:hypothetical protein [Novipirellula aureliae]|nr:hypothetical protein [Novipirellula aureliae]